MLACKRDAGTPAAAGAPCPWTTIEAEACRTNGTIHGPSRQYLTIAAESSGRKYVELAATGQFVEFTATAPANAMVVRFSIPDAPTGGGLAASLSLSIDGTFVRRIPLSSRHAWIYGDFPWSNDPSKGKAHHFYDETNALIGMVRAGQVLRLQYDATPAATTCAIDLVELENIAPPARQPAGSLSLVDFGAIADDDGDDSAAMTRALAAAAEQGKTLWIPVGEFRLDGQRLPVGNVRVQGAGMWYSRFTGKSTMFAGTGKPVRFADLAIFGEIDRRVDDLPENAFDGNFGDGSVFTNLWIEHVKCAFWTSHGTVRMRVENCRMRNVMADGLNFCDGTSDSVVTGCHLRNTGDDALATWSTTNPSSSRAPCERNSFTNNTIEMPWLANGIAIYGGTDHRVSGNRIVGTVFSGGGILISSGFEAVPFRGTIHVENNRIAGAGGDCYIGESIGGLWINVQHSDIEATIAITNLRVEDSAASGLSIHGPKAARRIVLRDVAIAGATGHGIEAKPKASGALTASGLRVNAIGGTAIHDSSGGQFVITADSVTK
jgi:hypothetical protein